MNDPTDLTELQHVLDRATDRIQTPPMAPGALLGAQRVRRRRRGIAAGVAAAAVVAVVTSTVVVVGSRNAAPPGPSGTPTPQVRTAPAIPRDAWQPEWDPETVATLPWTDRTVLPRSLAPEGPVLDAATAAPEPAVAVVGAEKSFALLDRTGAWTRLAYPDETFQLPFRSSSAVSADGTRVAVTLATGLWWRDVTSTAWQRVDFPDDFEESGEYGASLTFADGGREVLLSEQARAWSVDLDTGAAARLAVDTLRFSSATAADGTVVAVIRDDSTDTSTVAELVDGEVGERVDTASLQDLSEPAASGTSLAVVRRAPGDRDGLLALARGSLETRAFLPLRGLEQPFAIGGLGMLGWLDDDTVLVYAAATEGVFLFSWDVTTGEKRLVSEVTTDGGLGFAAGPLSAG